MAGHELYISEMLENFQANMEESMGRLALNMESMAEKMGLVADAISDTSKVSTATADNFYVTQNTFDAASEVVSLISEPTSFNTTEEYQDSSGVGGYYYAVKFTAYVTGTIRLKAKMKIDTKKSTNKARLFLNKTNFGIDNCSVGTEYEKEAVFNVNKGDVITLSGYNTTAVTVSEFSAAYDYKQMSYNPFIKII